VELSRQTGLAKTTLTSMLDRMESSGYIQRTYDKADRRQIRILLTDKAKALSNKYESVSEEMSRLFYEGFSDEEILTFEETLKRVLNNLTKENISEKRIKK
jgi:DNA-binding MarR family transcriptional regulator